MEDKLIILGSVTSPTDVTAANGGLLLRGATDKEFKWNETDGWKSNQKITASQGFVGDLSNCTGTATGLTAGLVTNGIYTTDKITAQ